MASRTGSLSGETGVAPIGRNLSDRIRWNTAFAYLDPVRDRVTVVDHVLTVRANCVHYWHAVGTRARQVVESCGRLHGLDNLYVGDASIMPTVPRANTHLPTIAVARRVAAASRTRREAPQRCASRQ
jgi:hypothetical protein